MIFGGVVCENLEKWVEIWGRWISEICGERGLKQEEFQGRPRQYGI